MAAEADRTAFGGLSGLFTLYHTNDFHNHLSVAQADRLRHLRESAAGECLLLDAGDAGGSGNITYRANGEPILDRMSEAGYDAMTVGNRDFHFSRRGFRAKLSRAKFPVLCANVRSTSPEHIEQAELLAGNDTPHREITLDELVAPDMLVASNMNYTSPAGWRVSVFGLTVPMITERMLSRKVSAWVFDDPIATAAKLVPVLREEFKPDVLIALTHIGHRRDRELAEAIPDIDLIIGGHSHTVLERGDRIGDTLIVQTGFYGHSLGIVTAEQVAGGGRPVLTARLETL